MRYWTDYPISELGDLPLIKAPIRECKPIKFDGNKYVEVIIENKTTTVKYGYIYTKPGRSGKVPVISKYVLNRLEKSHINIEDMYDE